MGQERGRGGSPRDEEAVVGSPAGPPPTALPIAVPGIPQPTAPTDLRESSGRPHTGGGIRSRLRGLARLRPRFGLKALLAGLALLSVAFQVYWSRSGVWVPHAMCTWCGAEQGHRSHRIGDAQIESAAEVCATPISDFLRRHWGVKCSRHSWFVGVPRKRGVLLHSEAGEAVLPLTWLAEDWTSKGYSTLFERLACDEPEETRLLLAVLLEHTHASGYLAASLHLYNRFFQPSALTATGEWLPGNSARNCLRVLPGLRPSQPAETWTEVRERARRRLEAHAW